MFIHNNFLSLHCKDNINELIEQQMKKTLLLLCLSIFVINACEDDIEFAYGDSSEFDMYIHATNPATGLDYTAEELAALLYNPRKKEDFSEGQTINLSVVTTKEPSLVKLVSGDDFSEIGSISQFSPMETKFKSDNFTTSLENLRLLEIGDKLTLKLEVTYQDGTSGADYFIVKRIKFIDPNADLSQNLVGYWRFDNPNNLLQASIGNDLILNGAASHSAVTGVNAEDGAALLDVGTYYDIDHGMPASGGAKVNAFTMVWDVKISSADFGKYLGLLQCNIANDSDGAVYINPDGGFWFNGGNFDYNGTIKPDTWHRIVLTVDAPEVKLYVDGVLINYEEELATPDGQYTLDPSKFSIFADNSSNAGNNEDIPVSISEFMLFDAALEEGVIESFPPVTEPAIPTLSQDLVGRWKFDDSEDLTKASYGNDIILNGAASHSAVTGVNAEDGAALLDVGTYYDIDHGMPASGGAKVNAFTMVWDVKISSADFGKYLGLLQCNIANDSDGAVYINPDGGFWFNGGNFDYNGTIKPDTWHRIVLTVDAPEVKLYVDGVLINYEEELATPDGQYTLDPSKFSIFADNSSNAGNNEDIPVSVTDFLLFGKALDQTVVEGLPSVDTPIF